MSLAISFMDSNKWTDDEIEAGKDTCRSIIEMVRKDDIDHRAWTDFRLALAKASLARESGGDPNDFDLDIESVSPGRNDGGWSIPLVKRHPRAHILFKELISFGDLPARLPPTLRVRACGGPLQADKYVLSDVMALGCHVEHGAAWIV